MKNDSIKNGARLGLITAVLCAAFFALITFAIKPLYVYSLSVSPLNNTVLPTLISYLYQLIETVSFAVCFAMIIYAAVVRSARCGIKIFLIYVIADLVRHAADLGTTYLTFLYIDSADVFNSGINLLIEALCAAVVLAVSVFVGKAYREMLSEKQKAARITGDLCSLKPLEVNTVYSRKNPLLLCALISGILLSALKIAMRISHDVKYTRFFGAPEEIGEILLMIAYYLSDVLICALVYAVEWVIFSRLIKADRKD